MPLKASPRCVPKQTPENAANKGMMVSVEGVGCNPIGRLDLGADEKYNTLP
jgi:hypothetical protein